MLRLGSLALSPLIKSNLKYIQICLILLITPIPTNSNYLEKGMAVLRLNKAPIFSFTPLVLALLEPGINLVPRHRDLWPRCALSWSYHLYNLSFQTGWFDVGVDIDPRPERPEGPLAAPPEPALQTTRPCSGWPWQLFFSLTILLTQNCSAAKKSDAPFRCFKFYRHHQKKL